MWLACGLGRWQPPLPTTTCVQYSMHDGIWTRKRRLEEKLVFRMFCIYYKITSLAGCVLLLQNPYAAPFFILAGLAVSLHNHYFLLQDQANAEPLVLPCLRREIWQSE